MTPGFEVVMMDPKHLIGDSNSRYGLKKTRIETLANDIQEKGEVMVPLEVTPLETPIGTATHRITMGHYRHAAVSMLNESGAGLLLPVIITQYDSPLIRLKRQLAENIQKESLSPIDIGEGIKQLKDAGEPMMSIRKIFAAPGGRKGNVVQDASNSYINMHLSFLEFAKSIQEKIHDGRIGVAAAYQLTRVSPEKRADVLADAEAERIKLIELGEKDEEKLLSAQKKEAEARELETKLTKEHEAALATAAKLDAEVKEKAAVVTGYYAKVKATTDKEAKEAAQAEFKLHEAEHDEKQKAAKAAKAAADKIEERKKKLAEKAAAHAQRLKEARAATKKTTKDPKVVGAEDVKKAAAKVEGAIAVPLNANQMRTVVADMATPSGYPMVTDIFKALKAVFAGLADERKLLGVCAKITGEKKKDIKGQAAA